jgi:hypothetical protein
MLREIGYIPDFLKQLAPKLSDSYLALARNQVNYLL